ncbi:MAG: cyclic nucleotide-binding domain-containing protein, partial [Dehalococcoidia bacterium]
GSAPNRLLDTIPCSRDPWSRVVVDETLAVPECPEVWALGDCAAVPDRHKGGTCPPTAQYALREAKHLARNILAAIKGQRLRPFSYRNMGVFVPLGRFSAAGDVMGLKVSGFLAWWLYRTYYLYQLPRLERKLRVMIDWTLELIFRRDIVKMDVIPSQGINRVHYEEGEIIYRQGGLARNFYIIIAGEVGVYRQGNGEERSVATLRAGEFFGEMSLLQGVRHTASVRALTPVDLLAMNGTDFSALAASSKGFGELLADVMRQRLSGSDITGVSRAGLDGENGRTVPTSGREE